MVTSNTIVTIDESSQLTIAINSDDNLGLVSFKNTIGDHINVNIVFGDVNSIDTVINALKSLKGKLENVQNKLITPNSDIIIAKR